MLLYLNILETFFLVALKQINYLGFHFLQQSLYVPELNVIRSLIQLEESQGALLSSVRMFPTYISYWFTSIILFVLCLSNNSAPFVIIERVKFSFAHYSIDWIILFLEILNLLCTHVPKLNSFCLTPKLSLKIFIVFLMLQLVFNIFLCPFLQILLYFLELLNIKFLKIFFKECFRLDQAFKHIWYFYQFKLFGVNIAQFFH